jgi:nitrate reductase gamma subunit
MNKVVVGVLAFGLVFAGAAAAAYTTGLRFAVATVFPYAAIAVFLLGVIYRVALKWGKAPVPFRIPVTCGQQQSLPWLPANKLDNPSTTLGVIGRMALELLVFRSLFRNVRAKLLTGGKIAYQGGWELWAAAMAFHWALLIIVLRHMRYFTEPVPFLVTGLARLDGLFELGVPALYISNALVIAGLGYVLLRRIFEIQVRFISLPSDYFAASLLLGIVLTGAYMRHFGHTDVASIKELAIGLITFHPVAPAGIGSLFYLHLTLVSFLLAYFPFSKLMHMPGVLMSPTRNLANNNRAVRHVNPWNAPVKVHTYEEWEDEFRDKIEACGLPLEKKAAPAPKKAPAQDEASA